MNQKQVNQEKAKWQRAIHDVKQGNRDSFVDLVKQGGGDHYYAKDCSKREALSQIRMAIELLDQIGAEIPA